MVSRTRLYITLHVHRVSCWTIHSHWRVRPRTDRSILSRRNSLKQQEFADVDGIANTHSDVFLLILSDCDRTFVWFSTNQRGISNNTQFCTTRIPFDLDVTLRHCVIRSSDAASYNRSTGSPPAPLRKHKNSPILCLVYGMSLMTMTSRGLQPPQRCIRRNGGIAPWILNPCSRYRWKVSFRTRPRRSVGGSQCDH